MPSDLEKAIDTITPTLGKEGAEALGNALQDLKDKTDNDVGQQVLGWVEDAVRTGGPDAVVALKDWLVDMANGEDLPPWPEGTSLRVQSDMLAALQKAEMEDKSKFKDQMVLIGDALGSVLLGIVSGLIK